MVLVVRVTIVNRVRPKRLEHYMNLRIGGETRHLAGSAIAQLVLGRIHHEIAIVGLQIILDRQLHFEGRVFPLSSGHFHEAPLEVEVETLVLRGS